MSSNNDLIGASIERMIFIPSTLLNNYIMQVIPSIAIEHKKKFSQVCKNSSNKNIDLSLITHFGMSLRLSSLEMAANHFHKMRHQEQRLDLVFRRHRLWIPLRNHLYYDPTWISEKNKKETATNPFKKFIQIICSQW